MSIGCPSTFSALHATWTTPLLPKLKPSRKTAGMKEWHEQLIGAGLESFHCLMFSKTNHNLARFARSSIDHDATDFKVTHHNCPAGKATFWMFHSVQNRCHLWSLGSTIVSIQWRMKRGIGENTQKIMQQRKSRTRFMQSTAEPTTAVLPIWPDQWPTDHPDAQIHSGSVTRPGHRHKQGTGSNPGQVTLNPRWRLRFNIHSQDSPDWWQAFPVNCKGVLLSIGQGVGEGQ